MNYKFVLVDNSTGADTKQWVLTPPVTVGRCPTAEINITDGSISRKHCQFLTDPYGSLIVRDLGSKNGVYIDDRRVEKAVIVSGSEVRMGVITFRVEMTDEEVDEVPQFGRPAANEAFDADETQRMQIFPPSEDIYDIG